MSNLCDISYFNKSFSNSSRKLFNKIINNVQITDLIVLRYLDAILGNIIRNLKLQTECKYID